MQSTTKALVFFSLIKSEEGEWGKQAESVE